MRRKICEIARSSVAVLLHRRAAGGAEIALLAHQAGGNRTDVGNFPGAETIDVGGAGAALLGRALVGKCRTYRDYAEHQSERCGKPPGGRKSDKFRAHEIVLSVR